jgi:hypothetical protein
MPGIGRSLALPKSFAPRRTDEEFNERRVDRFVYRQPKTIEDFIMDEKLDWFLQNVRLMKALEVR